MVSVDKQKRAVKHHLTINEKILLHLLEHFKSKNSGEAPLAITQKGIAERVHIRWNHVPRAVAKLKRMDFVFETASHVEGKTRRQKVYYLTDQGKMFAKKLRNEMSKWDVYLKKSSGEVVQLKLADVNSILKTNYSPLKLFLSLSEDNIIDAKEVLHVAEKEAKEAKKAQSRPLEDYLKSLSKATPRSLYKSSISTVHESNHGDLLTRFTRLPFYKCYIYGEKNVGIFPAEGMLRQEEIPLFYISKSGHSMMNENPEEFYDLVLRIIQQVS